MNKIFLGLVFLIAVSSCSNKQHKETPKTNYNSSYVIVVQPLGGISNKTVLYVSNELKKIYPQLIVRQTISLPASAYYSPRNRYRADSLINYLSRQTSTNEITIGLTDKDISTKKDNIPDWGVMGLGFCPGNACVASTFRLSKNEMLQQLFKVVIHELGHTQGLPHCSVPTCFMRDAEGHNPTNEEKEFCPSCKKLLEAKGWLLK